MAYLPVQDRALPSPDVIGSRGCKESSRPYGFSTLTEHQEKVAVSFVSGKDVFDNIHARRKSRTLTRASSTKRCV